MENVERKILIPENFHQLPDDQKELISNEMFQYLWGWKNKKHDKPISVNGEVYWLRKSPNQGYFIFYTDEHASIWGEQMFLRYERHIGVGHFRLHPSKRKEDFHTIAEIICGDWVEGVVGAKQRVEDWKVRRKELFPEKYEKDATHEDKCEVA